MSIDSFFGSVEIVISRELILRFASFLRVNFSFGVKLLKWSKKSSVCVHFIVSNEYITDIPEIAFNIVI